MLSRVFQVVSPHPLSKRVPVREAVFLVFNVESLPPSIRFPAGRMLSVPVLSRLPPASFPLWPLWLKYLPRKFFPIIGKLPKNFSNHWKKWAVFSNHWKIFFQSLEKRRLVDGLADCAGGRGLIPCLAGRAAPCRSAVGTARAGGQP